MQIDGGIVTPRDSSAPMVGASFVFGSTPIQPWPLNAFDGRLPSVSNVPEMHF